MLFPANSNHFWLVLCVIFLWLCTPVNSLVRHCQVLWCLHAWGRPQKLNCENKFLDYSSHLKTLLLTTSLPSCPQTARILQPTLRRFLLWVRLLVYWLPYKGLAVWHGLQVPRINHYEDTVDTSCYFCLGWKRNLLTFALSMCLMDGLSPHAR